MTDGPVAVWEFTLYAEQPDHGRSFAVDDVHTLLRGHCKKYTFQLESCPSTGRLHYQGRLSLFKKKRLPDCVSCFPDTGISLRPTVKSQVKGEAFYCMKADTRVDGPWTEESYKEPKKPTKQLLASGILEQRLPWQQSLYDMTRDFDMRTIHCVICKSGNNGKTTFGEWLEFIDAAFECPPFTCMEDIMQCCMCVPPQKMYLIDLPRAMPKERMYSFFAGIEKLKDGVMWDKRYHFKKRRIDRPCIILFTNREPDVEYLSRDRWAFWTIGSEKQLLNYTVECQQ